MPSRVAKSVNSEKELTFKRLVILNAVKDLFADLQGEKAWRIIDPSLRSG